MNRLFKPGLVKMFITVLSIMLAVKLAWFAVEMTLLRSRGVEMEKNLESRSLYYRARFASQKIRSTRRKIKKPAADIKSFKLLAIYHSPKRTVVTVSKKGKSSVLVRGDNIDGYVLDDATATEAIFLRGGKRYRLKLEEPKAGPGVVSRVRTVRDSAKPAKKEDEKPKGEVIREDNLAIVDRSLLNHYKKNMKDIWKNIGISELREGRGIKGFRVNFVRRGSDFAKLGLRRGDVIESINGQKLDSYKAAFDIYKGVDSMDSLTLKIKRGKKEMELEYEIN